MSLDHLIRAMDQLDPNNLAPGLPGREPQLEEIYNFIYERLKIRKSSAAKRARVEAGQVANIKGRHMNKTIFVCGVPGTGKTATIMTVIHKLEKEYRKNVSTMHEFTAAYINGQHFSCSEQVYSEILYKLQRVRCKPDLAQEKLEKIFKPSENNNARGPASYKRLCEIYKIIIIDELDLLYNEKRQDVFYSLFDWPTSADSRIILVAIANAMDLPERFMRGRIGSRLGWNKLVFESYTSDCLKVILEARLGDDTYKCFDEKAITIATKRIGRTTGDARRILDTCRQAVKYAIDTKQKKITPAIIDKFGFQTFDLHRQSMIRERPPVQLVILKSILAETARVGEENVNTAGVFEQIMRNLPKLELFKNVILGPEEYLSSLNDLVAIGLIFLEQDKPLFDKGLFIKESSEAIRNLIKREPLRTFK